MVCCAFSLTVFPSLAFGMLGLVADALVSFQSPGLAVYAAVSFVYALNILVSFSNVETNVEVSRKNPYLPACLPSLWGRFRWLNATIWGFAFAAFVYALVFRWWPGMFSEVDLESEYKYVGLVAVSGIVGTMLFHLLAVILWKTCRRRRLPFAQPAFIVHQDLDTPFLSSSTRNTIMV